MVKSMKETIQKEYLRWKTLADDQDVAAELQSMDGNEEQIEDAFYRNLEPEDCAE